MKKIMTLAMAALLTVGSAMAQTVNEGTAEFEKTRHPAFSINVDYAKKLVEEAVANRFKSDKIKGKSQSGMMAYKQANYLPVCSQQCDIYTKVDGTSKNATIYLFVSKGYDNFVTSGDDPETADKAKDFLISLLTDIKKLELKYQIEDQQKEVKKAQSEYEKLVDKKNKLEKDLETTKSDIEKADQNRAQQNDILKALEQKQLNVK